MNLADHIRSQGGTVLIECPVLASLAAACECSHRTLYMIALGHKQAGPLLAGRIENETAGAVARYELRPDVFGPAPQKRVA